MFWYVHRHASKKILKFSASSPRSKLHANLFHFDSTLKTRVSSTMSNGPMILTLDCDTYSNDPRSPLRALCYFLDPALSPDLAFVQFPQIFQGLNKNDIYACEVKRLYTINPRGKDGLGGPNYVGTACYFSRRSLQGTPSSTSLAPGANDPLSSESVLRKAHEVASCTYEPGTKWGSSVIIEKMFAFLQ